MSSSEPETEKSEAQRADQLRDGDVIGLIRSVQEESLKIKELSEMEKVYTTDTISVLRQFIEPLGKSYHLDPTLLSKVDPNIVDIVLTPQGSICLIYNNGSIVTRSLENLSSESLVRVLTQILPEIRLFLAERRQKLSIRTGVLEKVADEFKRVPSLGSKQSQRMRLEQERESKTSPKFSGV